VHYMDDEGSLLHRLQGQRETNTPQSRRS
jgi:hypothetical protein